MHATISRIYTSKDPSKPWSDMHLKVAYLKFQYLRHLPHVDFGDISLSFALLRCISSLVLDWSVLVSIFNVHNTLFRFNALLNTWSVHGFPHPQPDCRSPCFSSVRLDFLLSSSCIIYFDRMLFSALYWSLL